MQAEFFEAGEGRADRWSYTARQLELLEGAKDQAKAKGLWNFFLPDTGQGLSNLDYAYLAVELGKYPLGPESLNCSAPDTGNMEVLERVGTPGAETAVARTAPKRRDPLLFRHDRTRRCFLRRQECALPSAARRRRIPDQRPRSTTSPVPGTPAARS